MPANQIPSITDPHIILDVVCSSETFTVFINFQNLKKKNLHQSPVAWWSVSVSRSIMFDCSPRVSSVHGTLQARILEGVAILFSRGSSRPRDWTQVSRMAGILFSIWATREALDDENWYYFISSWEIQVRVKLNILTPSMWYFNFPLALRLALLSVFPTQWIFASTTT